MDKIILCLAISQCYTLFMATHVVQSPQWGDFKTEYGTTAARVGDVQYTKHKIPFTHYYYAYCPKVNPFNIDFVKLAASLKENNCVAVNFDVPNILKNSDEEKKALEIFKNCVKAPRDQFAKYNVLLDISKDSEELLKSMHHKHRYNLRYAQKHGVEIKKAVNQDDFEIFFDLFEETAGRQKYYIHPKLYYQKIWEILTPQDTCHILTAYHQNKPLASWMFFIYEGVLYYPYGGSSENGRNLNASTLVCWEGIQLGKQKNCKTFDMWGASKNPEDTSDPWFGFTNFKLKFGGNFVEHIDSFDFVINKNVYDTFNFVNYVRWKFLKVLK